MTKSKMHNDMVLLMNKVYPGVEWQYPQEFAFLMEVMTNNWRDRMFSEVLSIVKGAAPPKSPTDAFYGAIDSLYSEVLTEEEAVNFS